MTTTCECGGFYVEALEKARKTLVERARTIMSLQDRLEEYEKIQNQTVSGTEECAQDLVIELVERLERVTEERDLAYKVIAEMALTHNKSDDELLQRASDLIQRTMKLSVEETEDSDSD